MTKGTQETKTQKLTLIFIATFVGLAALVFLATLYPSTVIGSMFFIGGGFFLSRTLRGFRSGIFVGGNRTKVLFYRRAESPFHFWSCFFFNGFIYSAMLSFGVWILFTQPLSKKRENQSPERNVYARHVH